jgi:hypothetical protein
MSESSDREETLSNFKDLKIKLNDVIHSIAGKQSTSTEQHVSLQNLKSAAKRLNDLLFMLQFERMRAENNRDWDLVNAADEAVEQCEVALDSLNAAILRTAVIGLKSNDLAEMREIRKQIQSATETQQVFKVLIRAAGFLYRLVT